MFQLVSVLLCSWTVLARDLKQLDSRCTAIQDFTALSLSTLSAQEMSTTCREATSSSLDSVGHQNNTVRGPQSSNGFYDAIGNPISEQEYVRQAQYEQAIGLPAVRDREDEQRRKDLPLSIKVFSTDSCIGEHDKHITNPSVCVSIENGQSIFVESMSSLCKVTIFDDDACSERALALVDGLGSANGCYTWIDGFNSIIVHCAAELPL